MSRSLVIVFLGLLIILVVDVQSLGNKGSKDEDLWSRLKAAKSSNTAVSLFDPLDDDWDELEALTEEITNDPRDIKFIKGHALSLYHIVGLRSRGGKPISKATSREYHIIGEGKSLPLKNAAETSCLTCGHERLDAVREGHSSSKLDRSLENEQTLETPLIGHAETRVYKIIGEGDPLDANGTSDTRNHPVYYPNIGHAESHLYRMVAEKAKPLFGHAETRTYKIVGEIDPQAKEKPSTNLWQEPEVGIPQYGYAISRSYQIVRVGEPLDVELKRNGEGTSVFLDTSSEGTSVLFDTSLRFKPDAIPTSSKDEKTLKFQSNFIDSLKVAEHRNNEHKRGQSIVLENRY